MNLLKKFGFASVAVLVGASLAACGKNPEPTPEPEVQTLKISEVLNRANGEKINTKGVVFAKTNDGIYVNDGTASLFVVGGLTANVKDEVTIEGNYAIVNKMPEIKSATVTTVASGKEELQPVAKTIAEVAALDATVKTNYGQYYTVSGTVMKSSFGTYTLVKDDATLTFNDKSAVNALTDWELKDVIIDVVTTSNGSEGWTVSYCKTAQDIREVPINIDDVKGEIFTYVDGKMPTNAYGTLSLPKSYADIPNVSLEWSVKEEGTIAVANNEATVTIPETDTNVTLVLTLRAGEQTATKEYVVTNKAIRNIAIADLASTTYASKENIFVEGTVILTTRSNGSIYSNIIVDDAGEHYARIDSDEEENIKYTVGDKVKILGSFGLSNGIQRINAVEIEKVDHKSMSINWNVLKSVELKTVEDYIALADAMDSAAGIPLTLYKITNPYITTSATSGYNYLRFGATPETAKSGVTASDKKANYAAMSLQALNYTIGENEYKDLFEIGAYNEGAIKNVGLTMYAFCGFNIEGITNGQFVFANDAVSHNLADGINAEIDAYATTINASEAGTYALPNKIADVDITWTTTCPFYDVTTGAYTVPLEGSTYKFHASYTINSVEYTREIEITFETSTVTYLTVSEFNTKDNGQAYPVQGTIIGFATGTKDANDQIVINGMYISDGTEIAYISGDGLAYDSTLANGYQAVYYYGEENTPYQIGDLVQIQKASKNAAGISITTDSKIKVTAAEAGATFAFNPTKYETVSSKADFATVLAKGEHLLIKVTATEANPICFGSSKASDQTICLTNKIRIYFYENVDSPGTTGIKPDGTHTVATKTIASELNLGSGWWRNLGSETFDLTTNSTSTATKFTGSFYMVLSATTSGFYQVTLLPCDFNLTYLAPIPA